jgi:hypothetical protein
MAHPAVLPNRTLRRRSDYAFAHRVVDVGTLAQDLLRKIARRLHDDAAHTGQSYFDIPPSTPRRIWRAIWVPADRAAD